MFDVLACNAYVLWPLKNKKEFAKDDPRTRRIFLETLSQDLILTQIKLRADKIVEKNFKGYNEGLLNSINKCDCFIRKK